MIACSCLSQNVKGRQNICTLLSMFCPNLKLLPLSSQMHCTSTTPILSMLPQNEMLNFAVRAETDIKIFQKGQMRYSHGVPSLSPNTGSQAAHSPAPQRQAVRNAFQQHPFGNCLKIPVLLD